MYGLLKDIRKIRKTQKKILENQASTFEEIEKIEDAVATILSDVKKLIEMRVVGIEAIPGVPTEHSAGSHSFKKGDGMAAPKVSIVKKSAAKKAAKGGKPAAVVDFVFVDNQDDTCTVNGLDSVGNPIDISAVATLAVSSGDLTVITVDPPTGMTFAMHATGKLGTAVGITVTATWNDGSVGPFSFTLPVDVVVGPATGVILVPGVPTSH